MQRLLASPQIGFRRAYASYHNPYEHKAKRMGDRLLLSYKGIDLLSDTNESRNSVGASCSEKDHEIGKT